MISKQPISVCLIVRDEEERIEACLRSVLPFVREVVVVDTGSVDQTAARAQALGAKVFHVPWQDSFSAARNAAIEQATQPYIFMIDADERLVAESAHLLEQYCVQRDRVAGRVQIQSRTDTGDQDTVTAITRLFPNASAFRYQGRIHEQLLENGQPPRTIGTALQLLHEGYTAKAIVQHDKIQRNLRLLQLECAEHPDDPYVYYQIGKTHFVGKQYADAIEAFQRSTDLLSERGQDVPPYAATLLVQFAYALYYEKQHAAVAQVVLTGIELYPDFTDLYFVYGLSLIAGGDAQRLQEIYDVFTHCLRLGEPDPGIYETVRGVGSFRAHHNLGVLFEVTGDRKQAADHYGQAAAAGFAPAQERLGQLNAGAN